MATMAAKSWFYLSFARDGRFVGACVVEAASAEDAPRVAATHGIDARGGDIMVIPTTGPGLLPPYRLWTGNALKAIAGLRELRREGAPPRGAVVIEQRAVN